VARGDAPIVVVEIDGAATVDEVRAFANATRIPLGLREAYVRFAMRTVVGVAADDTAMRRMFTEAGLRSAEVEKVEGFPFLLGLASGADRLARTGRGEDQQD
jgi:hypothetical protein